MKKSPSEEQIQIIREVYHLYPTKHITIDMLKTARDFSGCGLSDCKKILSDYIELLSRKD